MKNTGICPKCNSQEVYTNKNETPRGDRSSLPISSWKSLLVIYYACLNCGYFEEYIDEKDLKDASKLDKLRQTWKKIIIG